MIEFESQKGNTMGRNLISVFQQELETLDKDLESRKSAMKVLKSYAKELDSKSISIFLAQVSEIKETRITSCENIITLYEHIARIHGSLIIPHINNIMLTIIKTLNSNADPFDVHQACSKAVSAIARYAMDPMTPEVKKQEIMHLLCKPLSDSLLSSEENVSSGAAISLQSLVELDNWPFCSSQMVNEVCQRVTVCLENHMQSGSHMGLVMNLVKRNGLVIEGYARLLVRAGVRILNTEDDCQKRLLGAQMVNSLIMNLDFKSIMSELTFVIDEFQKFEHDQVSDVNKAVVEAIRTAKRILRSNVVSGQMTGSRSAIESFETREDHEDGFTGFLPVNGDPISASDSHQRSRPYVDVNNINRSTTPRKFVSSSSSKCNCKRGSNDDQNGFHETFSNEHQRFNGTSELVSDIPTNGSINLQDFQELVPETKVKSQISLAVRIYFGLFVVLFAVVWYLLILDVDEGYNLVPT